MKNILFFFFCACVVIILIEAQEKYANRRQLNIHHIELPRYARPIPGDRHNYRSAQLSLARMDSILSTGLITTVIRLNGNGGDAGGVPAETERRLCAEHGVQFIRIDAHAPDAALTAHALLLEGRTLIHCRHGFDRTGALVGYHLRQLGFSREDVIQYNGWKDYATIKGEKYRKYLAFIE